MRDRSRILTSLEGLYREAFDVAERRGDEQAMSELDFDFRRDQVWLEVLLDLRDALTAADMGDGEEEKSLLTRAKELRDLTRGR